MSVLNLAILGQIIPEIFELLTLRWTNDDDDDAGRRIITFFVPFGILRQGLRIQQTASVDLKLTFLVDLYALQSCSASCVRIEVTVDVASQLLSKICLFVCLARKMTLQNKQTIYRQKL